VKEATKRLRQNTRLQWDSNRVLLNAELGSIITKYPRHTTLHFTYGMRVITSPTMFKRKLPHPYHSQLKHLFATDARIALWWPVWTVQCFFRQIEPLPQVKSHKICKNKFTIHVPTTTYVIWN